MLPPPCVTPNDWCELMADWEDIFEECNHKKPTSPLCSSSALHQMPLCPNETCMHYVGWQLRARSMKHVVPYLRVSTLSCLSWLYISIIHSEVNNEMGTAM